MKAKLWSQQVVWMVCAMLALTAACADGGGDDGNDDDNVVSIAEARAQADGSEATVEGFVTVAPGTFASATGEQGFAIQSGTDGIYVSMEAVAEISQGDEVRVTGNLAQLNNLTVLMADASAVEKLTGTQQLAPQSVPTGSVNEDVEGELIKVSGTVTQEVMDDSPFGFKVFIDDGSGEVQLFIHLSDSRAIVDLSEIAMNDQVEATGMAFQFNDTYEVNPRGSADFTEVTQ